MVNFPFLNQRKYFTSVMSTSHKTIQFLLNTIIFFFLTIGSSAFSNIPNWDNAQWIWQQEDSHSNTWMSFRKTVALDEVPEKVEAYISVDGKFWLWINGDMVLFEGGLTRGPIDVGVTKFKRLILFK